MGVLVLYALVNSPSKADLHHLEDSLHHIKSNLRADSLQTSSGR
jgi:hypothetical protein